MLIDRNKFKRSSKGNPAKAIGFLRDFLSIKKLLIHLRPDFRTESFIAENDAAAFMSKIGSRQRA
jgi:hypothetical protein